MPTKTNVPSTPLIRSFAKSKRLGWSAKNVDTAVSVLNRAEVWLQAQGSSLREATTEDLDEYLGMRLDTVSPNTAIVDRRQLRAFYKWATTGDDPYLQHDPARRTGVIKGTEPDADLLPDVAEWEYKALLATCRPKGKLAGRGAKVVNDRRDRAIITLLWETGLRRAEVARLRYADIDWDEGTAHLARTKGRSRTRSRNIVLGEDTMEALTRYVNNGRGEHDGALFESTHRDHTGTPKALTDQSVYLMLKRRARLANATQQLPGVVHAPTHAFRRTSAMNDIDDGITQRTTMNQKGWKDPRTYAHYTRKAEDRQAIEEMRAKRGRRHLRAVGD